MVGNPRFILIIISKVLDKNGISRLSNILEIYHSGTEPSINKLDLLSSLCIHAFHRTDSKDPDVHVLDG